MNNTKKEIKDDNQKLEAQFILRLPKELSDTIKNVLKTKPKKIKKYMTIQMNPETRKGQLTFNKNLCPLKLIDLPTIIESLKTTDQKIFFKTADIHQMYLSYNPDDEVEENDKSNMKKYLWPHGLTPPLKNVRKNRFRKTLKNKNPLDGPEIEKEVKWLLKMDNEAISVRWELIIDEQFLQKNENKYMNLDEKAVFGEISDSISDDEYQNIIHDEEDDPEEYDASANFPEYSNPF